VPWFVQSLLVSWLPFIALIGVWIFLSRQMQGGAGKAMGFGKSRAKLLTEAHGRVTFEDVAGVDEAKQDLQEIVEFLRDPRSSSASADAFRAACCWSALRAPARR
jgi:cell division protease FtsH